MGAIIEYTIEFYKMLFYAVLTKKARLRFQKRRLNKLLHYAKEHSEYFREVIPEDYDFSKIKPLDKLTLLENFDRILTDHNITFERVLKQIKENGDEGAKLDGKYNVTMTSGSTGNPTIIIQDKFFQNASTMIAFLRIEKAKLPVILVGESGGFGMEAAIIKSNMQKMKNTSKTVQMIDIEKESIDTIIEKLQTIGPGTIIGYTGVMTVVANMLMKKGIRIKEKQIFLSGEKCSDFDKEIVSKAFECSKIRIIYGCTEAGAIAHECKCGHLHVVADYVKIEPVDEDNNPVGYGVLSDKALITNLVNRVQPVIRYELTDRIVLHQGCPCGNKEDWLEIHGRTNDNLVFDVDGKEVVIPSISLLIAMAAINKNGLEKFTNYQIAVSRSGHLKVVLDYAPGADVEKVNQQVEEKITKFFAVHHLHHISCEFESGTLSKTQRGKYKRIYMIP